MTNAEKLILAEANLAVWDVLADRGARSGRGYMRTSSNVVAGHRRAVADAIAHLVPEATTPDNVGPVAAIVAQRLATDRTIAAQIAAATRPNSKGTLRT